MTPELDLVRLYRTSLRIRLVESRIAELYPQGKMRCPVHLSIGQEIPSAIFEQVRKSGDQAISTHRAHAHYLAMGGDLQSMLAEIYGKATGCSKGRGGSMHLIDIEKGFIGSSAIVGNSIPIGVGAAYAKMLSGEPGVVFIFLGDGAAEEGAFYESANFAAIHKLPVVFILENNLYSVYTGLELRQPQDRSLFELAEAIGLQSKRGEDSDFQGAFTKLEELTTSTRNGIGPSFFEIDTYRKLEHCGPNDDDSLGYRPIEERKRLKDVDLLDSLGNHAGISKSNYERIFSEFSEEIDSAINFAETSPFPNYAEMCEDVYAS
jgi:TPP-dependent pyruvate/acetoin dehydrogenase alpha subunit